MRRSWQFALALTLTFARALAALLAVFLNPACNDDGLTRRQPDIDVSVLDTGAYADLDVDALIINLGEVAIYSSKIATFKLLNPTTEPLTITRVDYVETEGGDWRDPAFPSTLTAAQDGRLQIEYAPASEGAHRVVAEIHSDALRGVVRVTVLATGVFRGGPDIAIDYESSDYVGPAPADCSAEGVCAIPPANALDFGTIGVGARGAARLYVRNTAECDPFPGAAACTSCSLTVAPNPAHHNLGLGFKAGTNDAGYFSFAGSTATPFELKQRDAACGEDGAIRFAIEFAAPMEHGDYSTVVVIESNDPDEAVIEIPVVAQVRNAPFAIIDYRDYDETNPSAPWSDPNDLRVLTRVHLDGRASYDPTDPTRPELIDAYQWSVVDYPTGINPNDFAEQTDANGFFSFWPPMVGDYTVSLRVHSSVSDTWSGETERSKITFFVASTSRLHVELSWDDPSNDQDLHLTHANGDDRLCVENDCNFTNCNESDGAPPIWFAQDPGRSGGNPHLDIDDTDGLGPENINITNPRPGTYRVYVHYYSGTAATRDTVKVWLDDILVAEYRRSLSRYQVWAVADITWYENGLGEVTPYPSDANNETGAIGNTLLTGCWGPYVFQ